MQLTQPCRTGREWTLGLPVTVPIAASLWVIAGTLCCLPASPSTFPAWCLVVFRWEPLWPSPSPHPTSMVALLPQALRPVPLTVTDAAAGSRGQSGRPPGRREDLGTAFTPMEAAQKSAGSPSGFWTLHAGEESQYFSYIQARALPSPPGACSPQAGQAVGGAGSCCRSRGGGAGSVLDLPHVDSEVFDALNLYLTFYFLSLNEECAAEARGLQQLSVPPCLGRQEPQL